MGSSPPCWGTPCPPIFTLEPACQLCPCWVGLPTEGRKEGDSPSAEVECRAPPLWAGTQAAAPDLLTPSDLGLLMPLEGDLDSNVGWATSWLGDLEQVTFPGASSCSFVKKECHRYFSGFLLGVVQNCRRESVLRIVEVPRLKGFVNVVSFVLPLRE